MAVVSEHSGDSNDGDPSKNPRDGSKKPREVVANLVRLPDHVLTSILARLRRGEYSRLSLVSTSFHRVTTSPELHHERLKIGNTEPVLYALISFPIHSHRLPCWYILNDYFRLREIENLANMPHGSAVVTIGSDMYVIGGRFGSFSVSSVYRIDCRFHKTHSLQRMHTARFRAAAGVIDGKIYVIGGCERGSTSGWVEVLDVKTEIWTPLPGPYTKAICSPQAQFVTCAVMEDKIYVLDPHCCFTYEPKEDKWETIRDMSSSAVLWKLWKSWKHSSCVVDDVLYSLDPHLSLVYPLLAFDPKDKHWTPVRLSNRHIPLCYVYTMANFGGKLVVLGPTLNSYHTWCIEITLQRREDGDIWGTVGKSERVLKSSLPPYIEHFRAPMV